MFLLRNLSSRPTSFRGSIETFFPSSVGGRLGSISETELWIFDTAAAHADDERAVEEKVRLEDGKFVDSMRKRHCGHTARAAADEELRNEGTSRRMRGLKLEGGIKEIATR